MPTRSFDTVSIIIINVVCVYLERGKQYPVEADKEEKVCGTSFSDDGYLHLLPPSSYLVSDPKPYFQMKQQPSSLYLFTDSFPYGEGEPFLETELKYLMASADQVFIIPRRRKSTWSARPIPRE